MEDKGLIALISGLTGAICLSLGVYITSSFVATYHSPKEIIPKEDLNRDGIPDCIVIKNNREQVIMYGIKRGSRVIWVSEKEFKKYSSGIDIRGYNQFVGE